jgi:hypothetical protein
VLAFLASREADESASTSGATLAHMGQEQAEDVLAGGPQGPPLRERLSRRWPRRNAVVIALLLGVGIGASGTHLWHSRSGGGEAKPDIHLGATLSLAYRYDEQAIAVLTIHNLDDDLVTLHGAELRFEGLRVVDDVWDSVDDVWDSSPDQSVAVLANDSSSVVTQLRLDCSEDIGRFGQVDFSAAVYGEPPERMTDRDVPVSPSLRNFHEDICSG